MPGPRRCSAGSCPGVLFKLLSNLFVLNRVAASIINRKFRGQVHFLLPNIFCQLQGNTYTSVAVASQCQLKGKQQLYMIEKATVSNLGDCANIGWAERHIWRSVPHLALQETGGGRRGPGPK